MTIVWTWNQKGWWEGTMWDGDTELPSAPTEIWERAPHRRAA